MRQAQIIEWVAVTDETRGQPAKLSAVGARAGMIMREVLRAAPFQTRFDTVTLEKKFALAFAIR